MVDLKLKFGMHADGYRKHTCVIVAEFSGGVMGLIVDAVADVVPLSDEGISAPPSLGSRIKTDCIKGMGRLGDDLVIILDVEKVLTDGEALAIAEAREGHQP